jgi:hypothetical protein
MRKKEEEKKERRKKSKSKEKGRKGKKVAYSSLRLSSYTLTIKTRVDCRKSMGAPNSGPLPR